MADESNEEVQDGVPKRRRLNPRTSLACKSCRQRKTRCSGNWPSCEGCRARGKTCEYEGLQAPISPSVSVGQASGHGTIKSSLPSEELRRKAIAYFRENYASTLLCFISPHEFIEDDIGSSLAPIVLLSIITLVSKFIPEFTSFGKLPAQISDEYAEITRHELSRIYEVPSISTIQACLILCIYEIGQGSEHRGWLRLGHAIRLGQLLKLHKLDSDPRRFDWGTSVPLASSTEAESSRRTFWCCFCLDRLLANGRDRIAIYSGMHITTRLPQSDEDFIYDRKSLAPRLFALAAPEGPVDNVSLFGHTIRIIYILGEVLTWHGTGGRHVDARCPWLPGMPFNELDSSLQQWRSSLPEHLDYTPRNTSLVIAAGQGRLWILMFLFFHQARASLHREYLPFTSSKDYDPALGPCDGLTLIPTDSVPPLGWWQKSTEAMIESANSITNLYSTMESRRLSASAYPFPGLCLLTAGSIHVQCTIFSWPSMNSVLADSRNYLRKDMEFCNNLGQSWQLASHWIRQLSLYYKLNRVNKQSWTADPQCLNPAIDISELKDGIMNYVREIGHNNEMTGSLVQKSNFDFESWISILDNAAAQGSHSERQPSGAGTPPVQSLTSGPNIARSQQQSQVGSRPMALPLDLNVSRLGNGSMFDNAWWDSWDMEDWNPTFFGPDDTFKNYAFLSTSISSTVVCASITFVPSSISTKLSGTITSSSLK